MSNKDYEIIKSLEELGLRDTDDLTPEQEETLRKALDPHEQYLDDVERLFKDSDENP